MGTAFKSKMAGLKRVNTRITNEQDAFIKDVVKKSKNEMTEGEVHRSLLEKGIITYKKESENYGNE